MAQRHITVVLEGTGGELDRFSFVTPENGMGKGEITAHVVGWLRGTHGSKGTHVGTGILLDGGDTIRIIDDDER